MTNEPSNEPMSDVPPMPETNERLKELESNNASVRKNKILFWREQKISDAKVVEALKQIASADPSGSVRKEAKKSLKELGIEAPPLSPELAKKRRDFWIGFGIFFGLNFVLWLCSFGASSLLYTPDIPYEISSILGIVITFLPWIVNIGLIIFLAFKRPQMALGMLAGFGVALLIVVCLFLITLAVCFVALGSYQ